MEEALYLSRRAQEEREAALQAPNAKVRTVHLQFAEAYDAKLRELGARSRQPKLRLVDAA